MATLAIDLDRFSTDERLDLLEQVWESLSREPEALPLSEGQRRDLDERLDELERSGPEGLTWDDVVREARRGA